MKYYLKCVTCLCEFNADPGVSTCPECGPFKGTLDVIYPLEELSKKYAGNIASLKNRSVFDALSNIFPFISIESMPPLVIGDTPFFRSPNLSKTAGIDQLWFKDDGRNPSGSLKDRASAVAIAMALESSAEVIATASTGNAASSLAALAASVSLKTIVFVPRDIPQPKLIQILIHGAQVLQLNCDYDMAFDLCQQACNHFGWYNRNTAVNPFTGEGKKSVALEIARDFGGSPGAVICPVGDGCILSSLYKGFSDLKGLGLIDRVPRLYGIQAEGADPLTKAISRNIDIKPLKNVKTIADSIAVGFPRDGIKALRAAKNTSGTIISVGDEEILLAQKTLASQGGIFAEPAASASYAGLARLLEEQKIDPGETIVVLITGHGLKDTAAAGKNIRFEKTLIKPNIDSIELNVKGFLNNNI